VLVSGDEDFVYAVNAVAYKGCRVEIAGFRSNTAPKLIDVSDYFIDLGEIADKVRKEITHGTRYDERDLHEPLPPEYLHDQLEMQKSEPDGYQGTMRVMIQAQIDEEAAEFEAATDYIRITDEH
jgi:hypothetical protein